MHCCGSYKARMAWRTAASTAATSVMFSFLLASRHCSAQSTSTSAAAAASNTFMFGIDLLVGKSGYYVVDGYDDVQPALTMVRGQTYTFDQTNSSNWFHPLGFSYLPDGAHKGVDELEEGIGNGDAPVYVINGELSELDTYEPQFFYPEEAWLEQSYTVNLTVTDPDVTEIFYFCHIHDDMSGRIHIVDAEGDVPGDAEIELYEPLSRDEFDIECGTFGSAVYAPSDGTFTSDLCPNQKFLCGDTDDSFDRCMHAIDCKMNFEMRIEKDASVSNTVAFMQQMIPHHENAVNMARILLKNPGEELNEEVSAMLREIANSQNAQITFMQGYLEELGEPVVAEACPNDSDDGDNDVPGYAIGIMAVLGVLCLSFLAAIVLKSRKSAGRSGSAFGLKGGVHDESKQAGTI